jgi:flagellar biosynthesis/type III secretory pathway M-ring protein FliF/YscJ
MSQVNSTTGLVIDRYPDDPYKWKEVKVSHTKTYIIMVVVVVGLIMLMVIIALVIVRVKKSMEIAKKESEKEAERVKKEMDEHQKVKEFERSGGSGAGANSNVSVLGAEGGTVVSAVPTTLAEAHALDGMAKKPMTYEDLYGKKEEAVEGDEKDDNTALNEALKEE